MRLSLNIILLAACVTSFGQTFTWPTSVTNFGPYTLLSGVVSATVFNPSGDVPTENDPASHRYHHHTRIWNDAGVTWIATSSAGVGEGDDGKQSVVFISTNQGASWTEPIVVVPSQSTWTTNHYTPGARFSFPRNFQKVNGTNYLVCSIEQTIDSDGHENGVALAACALTSTGIGTLYLINTNAYSATNGAATIPFNAGYRSALMEYSKLYGCWGGQTDGSYVEWQGFIWDAVANRGYLEPNTVFADDSTTNMVRLWRHYAGPPMTYVVYQASSTNAGLNWSWPVATTIPNHPSETTIIRLSTGQFAIVGNPKDNLVSSGRDPLYFALTPPNSFTITNVSAIRQGVTNVPVYAGFSKYGGAQYPGAVQVDGELYVSYSIHKESVGFSRFPIPGYPQPVATPSNYIASITVSNLIIGP